MIETNKKSLSHLPATSRLWIFQSSKVLDGHLLSRVSLQLEDFLSSWAAHGSELFSAFEIRYGRFVIIAVDESKAPATGCSIDGMMAVIQDIDASLQLDLLNRLKVAYREGEEVKECDVNQFSDMLKNGLANSNTMVFNNVLSSLGELDDNWEVPVSKSWHANLLP